MFSSAPSGVVPSSLHVLLRAERALRDRDVGEVHIPLSELVLGIGPCRAGPAQAHRASCQTGSGQESPNNFLAVPCQPEV
jgi:hypothetical protein